MESPKNPWLEYMRIQRENPENDHLTYAGLLRQINRNDYIVWRDIHFPSPPPACE